MTTALPDTRPSNLLRWLGLALLIIAIDQLTKTQIVARFQEGDSLYITSFFNLVRTHNPGAAFSFLAWASGWQRWFFIGLGTVASVFIVWMLRRHGSQTRFALALTLILGGAIGNVIDRIVYGYVVDFVQVHYGGWAFPAFNVADSAITVGAVLLVVDEFLRSRKPA